MADANLPWSSSPPTTPSAREASGAGCSGSRSNREATRKGQGWQSRAGGPAVGVHTRGRGPGDSFSLPYFTVEDIGEALERVEALGGSVVHPGERTAVCKDSEGSPFGLMLSPSA